MRILFTNPLYQITDQEFADHQRNSNCTPGRDIHVVHPNVMEKCPEGYADEHGHVPKTYNLHYFGRINDDVPVLHIPDTTWSVLRSTVAKFFLDLDESRLHMGKFDGTEGLPFRPLVCASMHWVMGPEGTRILDSDFTNVASDGADEEYLEYLLSERPAFTTQTYFDLRKRIAATANEGGGFIITR